MSVICAVCMNFVWRTVCIAVLSGLTSLTILVISIVYNAHIHEIISQVLVLLYYYIFYSQKNQKQLSYTSFTKIEALQFSHVSGSRVSPMLEVQYSRWTELDPGPGQHREQLCLHLPPASLPGGGDSLDWQPHHLWHPPHHWSHLQVSKQRYKRI